jgi:hypothetical protein
MTRQGMEMAWHGNVMAWKWHGNGMAWKGIEME